MNHLFLFTIGPVQSFISQARKTQDLWSGSKLLSDLIKSVIEEFEKNNGSVVFPDKTLKSKPNRFLGEIETDNPKGIGKKLVNKVKVKFKEMAEDIFNNRCSHNNKPQNFGKQIEDFLQIFWVALEYEEKNYWEKYKEIEQYLGVIKNARSFQQLNDGKGEVGRKCSLCGERNAIFYKKTSNNKKPAYIQNDSIELNINELTFGEGLCAVCFAKRFYEKKHFSSTARISMLNWISKIPDKEKKDYKECFNNFDEQLYFKENLDEKYLKKYNHFKDDDSLRNAKQKLKKFYEIKPDNNNDKKLGKPSKYYAIVMLDGDKMGKWLAGEFLQNEDKKNLKKLHKNISEELGNYAETINNFIKNKNEPKGKVIYAGGDDVMTFVNLEHLFDVLKNLREEFPPFENLGFALQNDKKSSASAGIAIAHYKTPLSEVLKWARKMEHTAKEDGGRDAFSITVLKHSGEIQKTLWKWKLDDFWVVDRLKELVNELNDDNEGYSNTFIKNINIEFQKLGKIENKEMFKTELKRLLKRSSQIKGDNEKKKKAEDWTKRLLSLYYEAGDIENFFAFLNIADFLVRRTK